MKTNLASLPALIASAPVLPLSAFVGKRIGWLRLVKPATNHRASYECAAWWQDEESETGIFPLILCEDRFNKGRFFSVATVPAKVTDCYFGSLWCGNAIGKYDKTADLNREATIYVTIQLPELVHTTGSATGNRDYAPDWLIVPSVIAHYETRAAECLAYAQTSFAEPLREGNKIEWKFDTLHHAAQWVADHAKAVSDMRRELGYMTEKGDSWRELFARNYDWLPE